MLSNEDEFQEYMMRHHIYKLHVTQGLKWLPKVDHIAGRRLLSEIDLIVVEKNTQRVIGYEFKFLQDVRNPSNNYQLIYSGFGQSLLYFYFGIDRSCLCIGISEKLPRYKRVKEKVLQCVSAIGNLGNLMESRCFGLIVYDERGAPEQKILRFLPPGGDFPTDKVKLSQKDKEDILAGKLRYDEGFLQEHGLLLKEVSKQID